MKIKALLIGLFLVGFAWTMQAQSVTPKVTSRQINQQKRIKQGVVSGALTKKETVRLQKQQRRIHASKKSEKADGVVTRKERKVIHARQTNASKNIYKQKNNRYSRH